MTNSNDNDDRGRTPGRSDRPRTGRDRPFHGRDGAGGGAKGHAKSFRPKGDRSKGDRSKGDSSKGDRPFRPRDDAERPRKPREGGGRPFRHDDRPRRAEPAEARAEAPEPAEERIAKVIARAGVASRRDAEAMIAEGRVTLNGTVLASPAVNVTKDDLIEIDGEKLPARERTRLWIFHKPRGLVTTARDPEGRPTVFESLPEDMPRVVAVGRLDINTEGLLLLTNDGGLARVVAHPETGWLRRYKVRAHGEVTQADLDRLSDGVTIDEMEYGPVEARLDRVQGDNVWITMGLREGKNREVKRILEHLGLRVNRLIRLSFGPFQLGDLEPGLVEEVKTRVLKDQLGTKLAEEAGVDFESPVREPIAPFGSPRKPQPPERRDRDEAFRGRPPRHGDERPSRGRDDRPTRWHRDEEEPAPKRPSRLEPKRSVWRAGEDESAERPNRKSPRRGADPREARAAAAERPRERVGAIKGTEGRKVVVERLVTQPREEERPARRPRPAAPGGDDRPRRRTGASSAGHWGDAPAPRRERDGRSSDRDERPRQRRDEGDRPRGGRERDGQRRPHEGADRPFRARNSDRPARAGDDRPRRGPPREGAKPGAHRGRKGDPPGGGFKGGPKGPPRGRRP
ncbi:MAG TPA: pseudouridine synthase [Microvirga sp.]|nr:pseudouridine synthase [Microvirga sp.]